MLDLGSAQSVAVSGTARGVDNNLVCELKIEESTLQDYSFLTNVASLYASSKTTNSNPGSDTQFGKDISSARGLLRHRSYVDAFRDIGLFLLVTISHFLLY